MDTMRICCNVDRHSYKGKPDNPGAVRNRLKEKKNGGIEEIDPRELFAIFENGMTIYPGALTSTSSDSWQSQQIIIADIDNDRVKTDENGNKVKDPETGKYIKIPVENPLTHKEALKICKENGLDPFLMYHTFTNSEKLEKYRIVFVLSQALTDKTKAVDFTARLTALFNNASPECADTSMADAARLIYGGRTECVFYQSTSITSPESFERLPEAIKPPKANGQPERLPEPRTERQQRALDELHEMRQRDIDSFDLAEYVEQTTGARRVIKGNTLYLNPCPICGHNDDFSVKDNLFKCFGKDGDIGGNVIQYLKIMEGLSDGEALERFNEIKGYSRIEWDRAVEAVKNSRIDKGYQAHKEAMTESTSQPSQPPKRLKINTMEDYTEKEFKWLINGYIPQIGITIIGADGGTGKGMLWTSLIADLSSGSRTIFERDSEQEQSNKEPKKCMFFSSEDNIEYVIKERLRHNNANMPQILSLDTSEEGFELLKIQSPEFEQVISEYKPEVCVLDPLQAFISPDVKMSERNQMRGELHVLEKLSGQYGVSFVLVMHTNKGNGNFGRKRLADSADLWDIARSVFIMGETLEADSYGNKLRYISHEKVVKGSTGKTILASIQNPGVIKFVRRTNKKDYDFVIEKSKLSDRKGNTEAPKTDRAKTVIISALRDMGVSKTDFDRTGITKEKSLSLIDSLPDNSLIVASSELDKALSENGISKATGSKTKGELTEGGYIKSFQIYKDIKGTGKSVWYTALLEEPESEFMSSEPGEAPFEENDEGEQLELDLG